MYSSILLITLVQTRVPIEECVDMLRERLR